MGYQKFCYWMDPPEVELVRETFRTENLPLTVEARIPCRVLKQRIKVGFVVPEAWGGLCKRKTSWYGGSERAGKSLLVSGTPVRSLNREASVVISESDFQPSHFPSRGEVASLVKSEEYEKRKPVEWDLVDPVEKDSYERWLKRFGVEASFEEVFLFHCANHANFLRPVFFLPLNHSLAPYSLSKSTHVCSSCLEFYGILGEQWPVRYVVPCIGAVQFAHLPKDRYFRVETQGKG